MKKLSQNGFTIIEILLIVGIISLLSLGGYYVYTQNTNDDPYESLGITDIELRDTQRKNTIGRLLAASESYAANNNGSYATLDAVKSEILGKTITDDFVEPTSGKTYIIISGRDPLLGEIQYELESVCSNDGLSNLVSTGQKRRVAARTLLENDSYYCLDNL